MSINTLEAFLHRLGNDPATQAAFAADPAAALDRYNLTGEERRRILDWDLHAIVDSGVSPMALMFGYVAAHGGLAARDEYVRILKAPPASAAAQRTMIDG